MRQCIPAPRSDTATCAQCGKVGPGLFWENRLKVLDFGVSGFPPIEPDTTAPVRCDRSGMPADRGARLRVSDGDGSPDATDAGLTPTTGGWHRAAP
jgi:hypothetical protein